MNHNQSLRELLLLPDGPPEGVWQAAMNFAFTSENETPDHLLAGLNPDSVPLSPDPEVDADLDSDEAEDPGDQTDDMPPALLEDAGEDVGLSSHTAVDGSGDATLDEAGEDFGG